MKHLGGYTIWEVITVMLISSVVITLAVSVFFRIQVYFHSETRNYSSEADFAILSDLLKRDLDSSRIIQNEGNILNLLNEKSSVSYRFGEGFIVREESQLTDTFHLLTDSFRIKTMQDNPLLVRQIEFQVKTKDLAIPFYYSKDYEKQVLYQTEKNNGNKLE